MYYTQPDAGSLTGMFGSGMMAGNDGNAEQQMMMGVDETTDDVSGWWNGRHDR